MGYAVLNDACELRVANGAKILKQRDSVVLLEAHGLLAKAQTQAQAMLAVAREEAEAQHRSGYEAGISLAKQEMAEQVALAAAEAAKTLAGLEQRIVALVVRAVQSVVGDGDERLLYQQALRRVANMVGEENFLTLRVSPPQERAANEAIKALHAEHRASPRIRLQVDAGLNGGTCLIESGDLVVDASLETQLAAIEKSLRETFAT